MRISECPNAVKTLEQIKALRNRIETLRDWLTANECSSEGSRTKYAGGASPFPDLTALQRDLESSRQELDKLLKLVRRAVGRMDSPGEALLIELVFIYGLDAGTIATGLSLTRTGFYSRYARSMHSLEMQLSRLNAGKPGGFDETNGAFPAAKSKVV